jgi:diaminobutyrate-2-oxoglutarate transaminase
VETFERLESQVRGYSRSFPTVFTRAVDSTLFDEEGREYIDFFAGAGVISYGHNNPHLKAPLIEYLASDGITHGLDLATAAKQEFLLAFEEIVLKPRDLDYRVQFPGPGGANAVESALKLARRATGRSGIISFTSGFHGMTVGALSASGNHRARAAAGVALNNVMPMPFDGFLGDTDTLAVLENYLSSGHSGVDLPAAFLLETVQGEGGVNVASTRWLRGVEELARRFGILLIVDDVQVGCGRTGTFFSFEESRVEPDIVCLSKALSGFGLPMAVTLVKPEYDVLEPGEHNGTFRGLNLAFVTATATLERYWRTPELTREVWAKGAIVSERLNAIAEKHPMLSACTRGRGLIQALELGVGGMASDVSKEAFANGLMIETAGSGDRVLKVLPPLTITERDLVNGLDILAAAVATVAEGVVTPHRIAAGEIVA